MGSAAVSAVSLAKLGEGSAQAAVGASDEGEADSKRTSEKVRGAGVRAGLGLGFRSCNHERQVILLAASRRCSGIEAPHAQTGTMRLPLVGQSLADSLSQPFRYCLERFERGTCFTVRATL
jgi:hypothetical protein